MSCYGNEKKRKIDVTDGTRELLGQSWFSNNNNNNSYYYYKLDIYVRD